MTVYRKMEWRVIILIAGMFTISIAMVQTGLVNLIGDGVVRLVAPFGPLGLAAGMFLLTAALTQVMGGQVTALVTVPIAISAAISLNTDPQAIAVGDGDRVLGVVPHADGAPGQHPDDGAGQLPVQRFFARRLAVDGGVLHRLDGGHGAVLGAVIKAAASLDAAVRKVGKMSRAGFEPATQGLKVLCSTKLS